MSATTRTHRPTSASPRLSRKRGIEVKRGDGTVYTQDRTRWDSSTLGTFRYADHATPAPVTTGG